MSGHTHQRSSTHEKVGVLVVHGIGIQEPGATVREVAAALLDAARAGGARTLKNESTRQGLRVSMRNPDDSRTTFTFEEVYWHDKVAAPRPSQVLHWILAMAPVFVFQSAAAWITRHETSAPIPETRKSVGGPVSSYLGLLRFALPAAVATITAALLAPLTIVTLALIAIAYHMVSWLAPQWRGVRIADTVLAHVIGDAFIYVTDGAESAMVQQTTTQHDALAKRMDTTVLVGHSQGAEIARRAVAGGCRPDAYVAVGSGQHQLGMPRVVAANRWFVVTFWVLTLTYPAFIAWSTEVALRDLLRTLDMPIALVRRAWDPVITGGAATPAMPPVYLGQEIFPLVAALAVFTAGALVVRRLIAMPQDLGTPLSCRTLVVRSPIDPVALGQGLSADESVTVWPTERSLRAILTEHVTYWSKPETGNVLLCAARREPLSTAPRVVTSRQLTSRWVFTLLFGAVVFASIYKMGTLSLLIVSSVPGL